MNGLVKSRKFWKAIVCGIFGGSSEDMMETFRSIPGGGLPPKKDDDDEDDNEEDHINP